MTLMTISCTSASPTLEPSTTMALATSTTQSSATSTIRQDAVGGYLVKVDPATLGELASASPIPVSANSWNTVSQDESIVINWEQRGTHDRYAQVWNTDSWTFVSEFEVDGGPHDVEVIHDGSYYAYARTGKWTKWDLTTGRRSEVGEWTPGLSFWDVRVLASGKLVALSTDETSNEGQVSLMDLTTGSTSSIAVGTVQRVDEESGYFDGAYQIPRVDSPGVVWSADSLILAYADVPEMIEVDLTTGEVVTHDLAVTSWLDRLWAYWTPAARAKGPELGTYSSAAMSDDGRHLFISGNQYSVAENADGALIEENEHLGVWVVNIETGEVVARHDTPIQFVRETGAGVVGVNTVSFDPWTEEIYLLEDDYEVIQVPVTVSGGCDLTDGGGHLICFSYPPSNLGPVTVSVLETGTLETVAQRQIGSEDTLHSNGVLEDWLPLTGT